jgi:hypothetical protein
VKTEQIDPDFDIDNMTNNDDEIIEKKAILALLQVFVAYILSQFPA